MVDADVLEVSAFFGCPLRIEEDRLRLPCRRSCAAAATAARDGGMPFLIDAEEFERGIVRPARSSIGGSSLAALDLRSSCWSKMKDEVRLGVLLL